MRRAGLRSRLFWLVTLGVLATQVLALAALVLHLRAYREAATTAHSAAVAELLATTRSLLHEVTGGARRAGDEVLQAALIDLFESLKRSVEGSLERGEMEKFVTLAKHQRQIQGVLEFSLLDATGRITHSSEDARVGARVPPERLAPIAVGPGGRALVRGEKQLEAYEAIRAHSADCLRCHPTWALGQTVGYLYLAYSAERLDTWAAASTSAIEAAQDRIDALGKGMGTALARDSWQLFGGVLWASAGALVVSSLALLGGLSWVLQRQVVGPAEALARSAQRLARGVGEADDLPVGAPGELGDLAREFREMAGALQAREGDLRRSLATIEAQKNEIEAFARTVSHDIKAPLGTISAFAQLTLEGGSLDPRQAESLGWILWNTRRLAEFVDGLLELAQAGRSSTPSGRFLLSQVVTEALGLLQALRETSGAEVELQGLDVPVVGHRDVYLQVLTNLLKNALTHGRQVGRPPRVRVAARRVGDALELRVSDDGPGIPPEDRLRLFQPFEKGTGSGGAGLGLAIAQKAAASLGGTLTAESAPGGGAAFRLLLPPNPPPSHKLAALPADLAGSGLPGPGAIPAGRAPPPATERQT
ncbi:MAG: sensor histidine kinase [Deferrisomatales bacterium]